MKKPPEAIIVLFWMLAVSNLLSIYLQFQPGIFITKPLLITTLGIWFYQKTKKNQTLFSQSILAGLVFSVAGDTFLMFTEPEKQQFFLLGLGSFLLTHLFYIAGFSKCPTHSKRKRWLSPWLVLPFLIFLICFCWYLWSDLPGIFKLPVTVYACVITIMAISALNVYSRTKSMFSKMLFAGALLFLLSDSMIALKKFKFSDNLEVAFSLAIMTTYLIGQYFIVKGSIGRNSEIILASTQTVPRFRVRQ